MPAAFNFIASLVAAACAVAWLLFGGASHTGGRFDIAPSFRGIMADSDGEFVHARNGLWLHVYHWSASAAEHRGRVLLLHGLGESAASYAALGKALAMHGFEVVAVDLEGHGRSEGDRSYFERFGDLLDACERRLAASDGPAGRLFVIGSGLGATLAVHLQSRVRLAGVVLASPAFDVPGVSPTLAQAAKLLSSVLPRAPLAWGLDAAPLTARVIAEIEGAGRAAQQVTLRVPTLLVVGGSDGRSDDARRLAAQASVGVDAQVRLYDLAREPVLLTNPAAAADVAEWLRARV